jgi:ribose transport system substrate-binding protein
MAAVRCAATLSPAADQYKAQIAGEVLVIVAADTIGGEVAIAKEGRVEALVGQRPFEIG